MIELVKNNIILIMAWVLALASMFFVAPSYEYIEYIDFRTLIILWGLMVITKGLMEQGVFRIMAHRLMEKTENERQLAICLVLICFFISMIITNDVALITFVPFTIYVFYERENKSNLIIVLVLETVSANLGSMLTPIGNPQNLYLFNLSKMTMGKFIGLMAPLSLISLIGVLALSMLVKKGNGQDEGITLSIKSMNKVKSKPQTMVYLLLLAIGVAVVLRLVDPLIFAGITLVTFLFVSPKTLLKVDYGLLFTFIGFFIFVGNVGNYHAVNGLITEMVRGREMIAGIGASQVISNVPAAILLSGFTDNITQLIKAVNIGGLGTPIASMASLITFKFYANEKYAKKRKYLLAFSLINIVLLVVLIIFNLVI